MPYYDDQIADDARFTLAQAVDDAVSDYVAAFRDHWGFDAEVPPPHVSQDDWLAMKRIDGEAAKVVTVAATLVRRKGAGLKLQADADFIAEGNGRTATSD